MFSAAFAVVALASCSDDLSLTNGSGEITDYTRLVGTLNNSDITRTGMANSNALKYPIVWSAGDAVNVYSLDEGLPFNIYDLTSGQGTQTGNFTVRSGRENPVDLSTSAEKIAITSRDLVYGVSATDDNKAKLTTKIPTNFTWQEDDAVQYNGVKYYTNDAPYWGVATAGANGQMAVDFKKLTGAIKIDATLLPQGTKAIVIASEGTQYGPLSGTFNTKLESGCVLAADPDLVNCNYIRADFPAMTGDLTGPDVRNERVFIFPLICGTYSNLKVIAIINDEGDTGFTTASPVDYIPSVGNKVDRGTVGQDYVLIREYKNVTVTTDDVLAVYPAVEQVLDNMTPMQISDVIANTYDDKHDFIFTITHIKMDDSYVTVTGGDNTIYLPANTSNSARKASIQLNFDTSLDNQSANTQLYIKEANYNGLNWVYETTPTALDTRGKLIGPDAMTYTQYNALTSAQKALAGTYDSQQASFANNIATATSVSGTYARKVAINLSAPTTPANTANVDIYLPTSRVTLGINDATNGKYGNGTNGDITVVAENSNTLTNTESTSGLTIVGDYAKVVTASKHTGGTLVKGDITVDELNITNPEAGIVKIDDASVANINYSATQTQQVNIFTVGSAAIKTLTDASDKVRIRAFWTGKSLTAAQITDGYDQADIYTAAQLASMGNAATEVGTYTISGKISQMHLGGSAYPWVGATINYNTNKFVLDGNGVGLRYMNLTAADVDAATPPTGLGLIRTISSANGVQIKNIDLNQAVLNTTKAIDNVGALVGKIVATGSTAAELAGSLISVKGVDFKTGGENVGGLIGAVEATNATFAENATKTVAEITKIEATGDNVGGLIGSVNANKFMTQYAINVTANGKISSAGSNVGGLMGSVVASGSSLVVTGATNVTLADLEAGVNNVGGLFGYTKAGASATDAQKIDGSAAANAITVTAANIKGATSAVGGLIGNADLGQLQVGGTSAVTVNVTGKLAGAYYVGGLVGLDNVNTQIKGYKDASDNIYAVTTNIAAFENTQASAGADYFNTHAMELKCGSFGGMIGYANAKITLANADYNIVTNGATLLSDTNKAALLFKLNVSEEVDAYGHSQYFWGDTNYAVGLQTDGYDYYISTAKQTVNSNYNIFKNY